MPSRFGNFGRALSVQGGSKHPKLNPGIGALGFKVTQLEMFLDIFRCPLQSLLNQGFVPWMFTTPSPPVAFESGFCSVVPDPRDPRVWLAKKSIFRDNCA